VAAPPDPDVRKALELLAAEPLDIDALAAQLDRMDEGRTLAFVRRVKARDQARLWAAAEGRPTRLVDLVPEGVPEGVEVIHVGRNSLPLFTAFEKRFARVPGEPGKLHGYNEGATRKLIGPGYFVAAEDGERGEVGVNYYEVPPGDEHLPDHWPKVKPNESGLQRFVFAKMVDYLRRVADGVFIGRAVRKGRVTNNYFLLCRTTPLIPAGDHGEGTA